MIGIRPGRPDHPDAARIHAQPLFGSLTLQEAEELAPFCEVRRIEKGDPVVTQGGQAIGFFVIETGEAEAVADGRSLRSMGPGDWFGEIAILEQSPRTATVWARSALTTIAMTATEFRRLEAEHPNIAATITEVMRERGHG